MNAVVATPLADAPASRALYAEGIPFTERVVLGEFGYGELVTELWNTGTDFVLIEWDIIPWPGATAALDACRHGWCAHRYPLHRGNLALSFGINKFKPEGPAPDDWATTPWNRLDGAVVPVLLKRLGRQHVHEPAVAHAKARRG